jgi:hypothetical protein
MLKNIRRMVKSVAKAVPKTAKAASNAVSSQPKVSSGSGSSRGGMLRKIGKTMSRAMSSRNPTGVAVAPEAPKSAPASSAGREARGAFGSLKKALKGRKIGPFKFKEGGMADKTGRAMKKTTADSEGRAMTKAPKKMMGGGMAKYAKGGQVACGPATRGYGAARKSK